MQAHSLQRPQPQQAADYGKAAARAYAEGRLGEALGGYMMALALQPRHQAYLHNAIALIGITQGYQLPDVIRAILADACTDSTVNCQPLASVIRSELAADGAVSGLIEAQEAGGPALEEALASQGAALLADKLLLNVLNRAVLVSPEFERLATKLRRHALDCLANGRQSRLFTDHLPFLVALASQCFNSEYAYFVEPEETEQLQDLLARSSVTEDPAAIAVIASYRPLFEIFSPEALSAWRSHPLLAPVIRQQVDEPLAERQIAADLPALTEIDDDLSRAMQSQYEAYPYPRWVTIEKGQTRTFRQVMEERFAGHSLAPLPKYNTDILIAGCGTGQQVAQVAGTYKSARLWAVDLSRTSLAYASRKLAEAGVKPRAFGQGDILALDSLDQTFDLIECMGVLHHMAEPAKGLGVLKSLLKPHGFLRIGLYSERARQHVVAARQWIADEGIEDSPEGVRLARRLIAALPLEHPVRHVMDSQDFYSISGLHDLIFNVHEFRYTPLNLKALLEEAGLEFLGFDHSDPGVATRYAESFPQDGAQTDLALWDAFEEQNPATFENMLNFWCRLPA